MVDLARKTIWSTLVCLYIANLFLYVFVNGTPSDETETNICDQHYYAKPTCIDQLTHYKCKCNPGYIWNGHKCAPTALNSYFEFLEKSPNYYVFLEKTFPRLNSFTITTWLQIHNYTGVTSSHEKLNKRGSNKIAQSSYSYSSPNEIADAKDTRTIFAYSYDDHVNALRCQISANPPKQPKAHDNKRQTSLTLTINILNSKCEVPIEHTYHNNSYWIHLALTWKSTGHLNVFINGQSVYSCSNIAVNKEIGTAGIFVLGQSHRDNFWLKSKRKELYSTTTASNDASKKQTANSGNENIDDQNSSKFDESVSFVGRLFNLNVWHDVKPVEFIQNVYNDCRLAYCGSATQWSDFRQGTRGNIKMKWPTELIWKKNCGLTEEFQMESCNNYCHKEIGPICRENIQKNILWPMTKANVTTKIPCHMSDLLKLSNPGANNTVPLATRHCHLTNAHRNDARKNDPLKKFLQTTSTWQSANVDACIQKPFVKLRDKVYMYHTLDNFDEQYIIVYLNELRGLCNSMIKNSSSKSIHDISALLDTLFYLVNAQHQIIKRNLDMNFYDTYPEHDDIMEYSRIILSIIDMLLGMGKESMWNASLPVGSEATRIVELIKVFSLSVYDYQLLNYLYNREEVLQKLSLSLQLKHKAKTKQGNDKNIANVNSTHDFLAKLPPYHSISIKLPHILYQQQLLFTEHQMPLNFKFPERPSASQDELIQQSANAKKDGKSKKNKANKKTSTNSPQIKTTTAQTNRFNDPMAVEQYEVESTTAEPAPDKPSSSVASESPVSTNALPSFYLGHVVFNDHRLLLPLFNGSNLRTKDKDPYALLTVYFTGLEQILPNHNRSFRPKDNNLNSIILTVELIGKNGFVELTPNNFNETFNKPIMLTYTFMNNFNISDTRCVALQTRTDHNQRFKWSRQECRSRISTVAMTLCECSSLGTFSITSDLYDPSWRPIIIENVPLIFASYIGCIIVSLFGITTFASLTYLKTKSITTSVHKNLCVSICVSQLLLMISLTDLNFDKSICQAFGLLNHYMLFVVFAWLMNEAFNLYISITYAAHQSSPVSDSGGSQFRLYLLGWILPAVMVIILLATKSKYYYDKKLCWFNLDSLWVNVSPMISMLAITILVMIFSAKEQTESSYTKNEKANKLIANHTKAVWSQIVLLTLCWTFAIMSLTIHGAVIKYLFAFLNCLQGSFLFIFYFLLNEEVRKYMKDRKKKKRNKMKESAKSIHNADVKEMISRNKDNSVHDEEDEDDEDEDEDEGDNEEEEEEEEEEEDNLVNTNTNLNAGIGMSDTSLNRGNADFHFNSSIKDIDIDLNNMNASYSSASNKHLMLTKKQSSVSSKSVKFETNPSNYPATIKENNYLEPSSTDFTTPSYRAQSSFSSSLNDSDYFQRQQYIQSLNQQAMKAGFSAGGMHQSVTSPVNPNASGAYSSYSMETRLNQPSNLDSVVVQHKKKPQSTRSHILHHQHTQLNQYQPQHSQSGPSGRSASVHRQSNFDLNEEKVTVL